MTADAEPLVTWLEQAGISPQRLTPQQNALLQAAFAFRQNQGDEPGSSRLILNN
jgi:hypothetical protein